MKEIDIQTVRNAARILRVIGHVDRLRLVQALEESPKNVKQLMMELKLSQVSVSKHLAVLKKHQIVQSQASANFRNYSIAYPNVVHVLNCLRIHGGKRK